MRLALVFALCAVGCAAARSAPDAAAEVTYDGFTLDTRDLAGLPDRDAIVRSAEGQIDLVDSVGLAPDVLSFFRGIPIVFDRSFTAAPARYGRGHVTVRAAPFARNLSSARCEGIHAAAPPTQRPDIIPEQLWGSAHRA